MPPALTLTEYTEPFSPWAWGSEGKLRRLRWCFGEHLRWRRVFIGTSDDVLPQSVVRHTGMPTGPRPAATEFESEAGSRAVVAAEMQGAGVGDRVLRRLREAFFLRGVRFASYEDLFDALRGLPGLSLEALAAAVESELVSERLRLHAEEAARPAVGVRLLDEIGEGAGSARFHAGRWRYAAPTLRFSSGRDEVFLAGWTPWEEHESALHSLAGRALAARPEPGPQEALECFASMADVEFEMVCGMRTDPPEGALRPDPEQAFWFARQARGRSADGPLRSKGASA